MEVFLLYWDNLDDLAGAALLKSEGMRKLAVRLAKATGFVAIGTAVLLMALMEPALGLGAATLLFVVLFYYRVTTPRLAPEPA